MYPDSAGTTMPRTRAVIAGNEPIFQDYATVNNLYPLSERYVLRWGDVP